MTPATFASYTQSVYPSAASESDSAASQTSPSRQFNRPRGGSIPPACQYFRLQPSMDSRTSNVTLPALSKFYVSRGIDLPPPTSSCNKTTEVDATSACASGAGGKQALSGASSVDGEWAGASTNPSTRPSSAPKLDADIISRRAPGGRGARFSECSSVTEGDGGAPNGPAALTLSSPTALLSSAPEWQSQFYRTKLCPFYVKDIPDLQTASSMGNNIGWAGGDCVNGDNCRFAHSTAELRPLPDLRKTKLCSSYTKKVACKNPKCPFAHSPKELRTSSSVFYKVTLCNFYKNGKCWNGVNCRFAHGNEELRNSQQQQQQQAMNAKQTVGNDQQQQQPPQVPRRNRTKEGLLPKPAPVPLVTPAPAASKVPPPPPVDTEVDFRRQSLSSLSTTDTNLANWKVAFGRQGTSCQAVHEECMETETATDDAWFDGDEVPEDPPGFSPLGSGDVVSSGATEGTVGAISEPSSSSYEGADTLDPALFNVLIEALESLRSTWEASDCLNTDSAPMMTEEFMLMQQQQQDPRGGSLLVDDHNAIEMSKQPLSNGFVDEDLSCLQVLLKYVQGQLDS